MAVAADHAQCQLPQRRRQHRHQHISHRASAFLVAPALPLSANRHASAAASAAWPRATRVQQPRALAAPAPPRHPPAPPRRVGDHADAADGHRDQRQPTPVVGARELVRALVRAGKTDAALVVVFFRAKWCRSCATLAPKVARVAAQVDREPWAPHIDWYSVDIVEEHNRALTSNVNVNMLPTFHFYHPIPKGAVYSSISLTALAKEQDDDPHRLLPESEDDDPAAHNALYTSILHEYLERSFIAGPFGSRRLQDNLKELFAADACKE